MQTKRTLASLLTLLTLGSTLIACGSYDVEKEDSAGTSSKDSQSIVNDTEDSAAETDSRQLTDLEIRQSIDDGVTDVDFNEREFRILTRTESNVRHYFVEGETGDPCDTAVFRRNAKIEDRFNILIEADFVDDNAVLIDYVLNGQNEAELYALWAYSMYKYVEAGVLANWHNVPVINLEQPWYNQYANKESTINDVLFALHSDLSISTLTGMMAIFFNDRLVQNYGIDKKALYSLVDDGKWTIDALISYTKDIYEDLNQNNVRDNEDFFGFTLKLVEQTDIFPIAFDISYTSINADGQLDFTFESNLEKYNNAVAKIRDFIKLEGVWAEYHCPTSEKFINGETLFTALWFDYCFSELRNMEDTYLILPYPKWDESQDSYYTTAQDEYELFCLPKTVPVDDYEFVGTIVEVLSAETYKSVYPAYYDAALKGRYSKEPETAEMIDLIMDGARLEFAFQFGSSYFNRLPYLFRELMNDNVLQVATSWTMIKRVIDAKVVNNGKFYDLFVD